MATLASSLSLSLSPSPSHSRSVFLFSPLPLSPLSIVTFQPSKRLSVFLPLAASSPLLAASSYPKHGEETKEKDGATKITSVSNPLVKHCVKLRLSSSYRRSTDSVLIVGLTPILEICKFEREKNCSVPSIDQLIILEGTEASDELRNLSDSIVEVSPNVMKKISGMQSVDSTQAIAVTKKPNSFCELIENNNGHDDLICKLLPSPNRILVLDGIQDPGNLGTLIRSARAFNWDGIFLLNNCCDPFNEKALRSARGASFQLPIISTTFLLFHRFVLKHNLRNFAGHPANSSKQTTSLDREFVDRLSHEGLCLVLGSEGNGLSSESEEKCELVSIPMDGMFESINVSVAGGIFLFMLQHANKE
ncbi:hypothetical protein LUZ60_005275 [Juncus effusus]|nr:hypothetical protein LUZ60_005275 [Juncus effusus]